MDIRKFRVVILCATWLLLLLAGCDVPGRTPSATDAPTLTSVITVPPAEPSSILAGSRPMIYDDDGSRDGIAALLYLLEQQEFSIKAIDISYGEAHPDVYIQYIGRVLDSLGIQDIPLGAGQDAPLGPGTPFPDFLRQLSDRFWDYPLTNTDKTYQVQDAAGLMVSTISQASEPVIIFMSGTFTTLAQALRLDPGIKDKIAAVYFMGGAVNVLGNITNLIPDSTNHVAEWNIYADPQAAKEVFESGLNFYMVPLDATNPLKLIQSDILPWLQGDPKAKLVAGLYNMVFTDLGFSTVEIFDLTAAVLTARPDFCTFQPLHLDVITAVGDTLGLTAVVPNGLPNIHACLEPDLVQVKQEQNRTFTSTGASQDSHPAAPIIGTWTGTASNNGFEMQILVTIDATCQLGQTCGRFDIPSASCSGTWTWVGMDGEMYQFQASNLTQGCGPGTDYLLPQPDGTVVYISRGVYGETRGSLQRVP